MADQHEPQWIARLTPLDDVLARITEVVGPVAPRALGVAAARRRVLAEDVVGGPSPAAAIALRDGWAVNSALTIDAGAYAPAPLPAAVLIDVGEPLPAGADAVAPFDAVIGRDGRYEALAPVTPGEGVLGGGGRYPRRLGPAPRRRAAARHRCRGAFHGRNSAGDGARAAGPYRNVRAPRAMQGSRSRAA